MTAFATYDDVEARWRTLSSDEQLIAATLLDDASDMIRVRWPDVDDRIASGALTEASLVRVVAAMVKRAMLVGSAEGLEAQSQTAGPFGVSNKFANPNANLFFTAEDIRLLDGGAVPHARMGWLA